MEQKLEINGIPHTITLVLLARDGIEFEYKGTTYHFLLRSFRAGRWVLEDPKTGNLYSGYLEPPGRRGTRRIISSMGEVTVAPLVKVRSTDSQTSADSSRAPMAGIVREICVAVGDSIVPQQLVAVMEAMKMQLNVLSPRAGVVEELLVKIGEQVSEGVELVRIKWFVE